MTNVTAILNETLARAKELSLDQKELALLSGVRPETISRAKKRGTMDSRTLDKLVSAVGLQLSLQVRAKPEINALEHKSRLRDSKWGLAWSNSAITDEVLIRKALVTGRFSVILQACLDFGLDRVRSQWTVVSQDSEMTSLMTRQLINDIINNITKGFSNVKA